MSIDQKSRSVVVSAPGKVLLAGGYLILDRRYQGLVVGLDARIHVHVTEEAGGGEGKGKEKEGIEVVVRSPQFEGAEWRYRCRCVREEERERKEGEEEGWVKVRQVESSDSSPKSRNPFVETTLTYALTYLSHLKINLSTPLQITILADNDYYSQPPSSSSSSSTSSLTTSRFAKFSTTLPAAHKTGLGSSAALVTALTSALLAHFLNLSTTFQLRPHLHRLHNLSQAAHCAAQGKVGSGFDVAAAVYGATLYRRFSPSLLETIGEPGSLGFGERLHRCVEDLDPDPSRKWDTEAGANRAEVQVPRSLRLVMCDVDCGSQTPGMVKTVLKWREQNGAEAEVLWTALQQGTEELCRELKDLTLKESAGIVTAEETKTEAAFQGLRDTLLTIRSLVREMSEKSGVPIEPDVQTELIDGCMEVEGVVGGVVPGAGGYDAVALLVRNEEAVLERLRERLRGWKSSSGGEGGVKIGNVKLLGVKQEKEGVKVEDGDGRQYGDWL